MIFLVTICAVSAEDVSTNDTVSLDDSAGELSYQLENSDLNDVAELSSPESSDDLKEGNEGTFDELDQLIRSSSGTLVLDRDYKKVSGDTVSAEGVTIGRGSYLETIDGAGHTLDASELGRIFNFDGGRKIVVKNITFINGKYDGDGGAVFADNVGITFENCRFINNTAENGGAIHTDSCPNVNDCYFENNTADSSGGAMYVGRWGGFRVHNSTFINNHANYQPEEHSSFSRYGGGAIYSKFVASHSEIADSTFINNTASYLGGAVNVQSDGNSQDTIDIKNTTFIGNQAASNGAVLLGTRFSNIDGCGFINNHADETGGAVGMYNFFDTLTNSYFENNSAGRDGGAVFAFCYYSGLNVIDNVTFINNSAGTYGGAVNAINTDISNSNFIDNNATDYGGAVVSYGTKVTNSTFDNNKAGDGTVLMMNDGSDINSAHSSQSNNDGLNDDNVKTDYTDRGIVSPMMGYPANVIWSDLNYVGYCCERFYSQPYSGIVDHTLSIIDNNVNGKPVGEYLKIMMYTYVTSSDDLYDYPFHDYVWEFTDFDYENSEYEVVKHVIELYDSGFRVPTKNALKVLDNGDLLRMDFLALDTADGEQDLFLFNWDVINADLTKESMNKTTFIGEKIDFKITVKNTGPIEISDMTIEDSDFSKELVYLNYTIESGNWTYDPAEKVWKLDSLKPGKSATLILTFKSTTNGTFYNNATLLTKEYVLKNVSETTNVYTPQLFTKKIALNKTLYNGEIAEFVIELNNTGDYPLHNVFVDDIADDGLIYVNYVNGSRDWEYKEGKFYLIGALEPNKIANFTVLFNTTKSGNFTNKATGGSDETENHTWEDTVEVFSPELTVVKLSLNATVYKGEISEFKIIVTNTGDCALSDVSITEAPDDGLEYVSYKSESDGLSYSNGVFTYNKELSVGDSIEFTVQYKTLKEGNFTNTVKVKSNGTDVINASNKTSVIENITNETDNETNTTNDTNRTDKPDTNSTTDNKTNTTNTTTTTNTENNTQIAEKTSKSIDVDKSQTGNPILILLLVLLTVMFEPIRRKK